MPTELITQAQADFAEIIGKDFYKSVTWSHWGGSSFGDFALSVIVHLNNEDQLQGMQLDDEHGRRITRIGRVDVAASSAIYFDLTEQNPEHCDYLTIDGVRWNVVRCEGRNDVFHKFTIRRDEKIGTKQPMPRR